MSWFDDNEEYFYGWNIEDKQDKEFKRDSIICRQVIKTHKDLFIDNKPVSIGRVKFYMDYKYKCML